MSKAHHAALPLRPLQQSARVTCHLEIFYA